MDSPSLEYVTLLAKIPATGRSIKLQMKILQDVRQYDLSKENSFFTVLHTKCASQAIASFDEMDFVNSTFGCIACSELYKYAEINDQMAQRYAIAPNLTLEDLKPENWPNKLVVSTNGVS